MLKHLLIENFQSHKHTELVFDDGINIIIGQSDSGKSAIIRALNWVINNKPSGEAFRSDWGGETSAQLKLGIYEVERLKGKDNIYHLIDDGSKTLFKSFGQDVPEEIEKLLNFSSLNIASQFDSPFLLAMSGGEVAKYLNSIVHLDKIDTSISSINSTLRGEKQALESTKTHLEELEKRERGFEYLEKAEASLIKLELLEKEFNEAEKDRELLSLTLERAIECQEELKGFSDVGDAEERVAGIEVNINEILEEKSKRHRLNEALGTITDIETDLEYQNGKLKEDEKEFEKAMRGRCPLCGRAEKIWK